VSSDNGGATDVIVEGQTGYVVPIDEDASMAERFLWLLNHPGLRERMGEAARRTIREKFSADAMITRLVRVYEHGLELSK
jgi:glycosyltransferase involved in cell wall biosynthesis